MAKAKYDKKLQHIIIVVGLRVMACLLGFSDLHLFSQMRMKVSWFGCLQIFFTRI